MSEYQMYNLIKDIERETGIDISLNIRKRENFYSRVVFFKIIKEKNPKMTLTKMGNAVKLHHTAVVYSLNAYKYLKEYSDFKEIEKKIRSLLFTKSESGIIYCNQMIYSNV